jgi:hypothetical protein
MQGAILQDDLALADDHQRGTTAFHAFEDVVLQSLEGRDTVTSMGRPRPLRRTESVWHRLLPDTRD